MTHPATLPPLLVPAPRRLDALPGPAAPAADLRAVDDLALPPEGYRLEIDAAHGAIAAASTPAGHAHARRTLAQLRTQYTDTIPPLRIEDAPALNTRGVMLDVSRSRVPAMPWLLRATDQLASLKLNHLQLYIEHAFAYEGHEDAWRGADPITPGELSRLDAHASSLGMNLGANQNCFGHMQRWLRLPRYAHLAETHGTFDFYGIPRTGPFSLCPIDPASLGLVRDLLAQQIRCVTSNLVNIGCDETADLGSGRSRDRVTSIGRTTVYLEYVNAVCDIARELGARPMLWGDIALGEGGSIDRLRPDAVPLAWGYEPDTPFDDWGRTLDASGRDWLVCPGTSSWRSFTGRTTERRQNLASAVRAGVQHNASGMLMTDWGDLGHRQQWAVALLAIAEGAAAAWNPDAAPDPRAISLHVFADRSLCVAGWLAELGDADRELRAVSGVTDDPGRPRPLRNASALFEHLHPCGAETRLPADPAPWQGVFERLNILARSRPDDLSPTLQDQLDHTLAVAHFSARLALHERGRAQAGLDEQLDAVIEQHERLWRQDARPGGLSESSDYYEALRPRAAPGGAQSSI